MTSNIVSTPLSQAIGTYGYACTFILGVVGHSCSLLTFSQRNLRSTSATLLFLCVTISDIFYLLMSLYDFFLVVIGIPQLSPYYIPLCRFRTFILNFAQTTSAWLLVWIAFDRLIRARLPHRIRQWCSRKNTAIVVLITILCSIALNSHVLQPSFATVFPFNHVICGPSRLQIIDYTIFYYITWPALQMCTNILVPALSMITCLIGIYKKVLDTAVVRRNRHLQKQMFFLMISKTILFLVCTLPYAAYRMVTLYLIDPTKTVQYSIFLTITAVLTILLNVNYSITFYIHCLTSTLFRQTFIKTINRCSRQRQNAIQPTVAMTA